ncbi:hypothetical protein BDV98DRAFT_558330 [Pterulicium gracile]|uniref:Zinc-ribbon 15 domain-containing protein n=1 Tax=Pterulicium gracile TaxID=1884261 RepID=A0A5C3R3Z2_9AGAR|nr:hypothetical protein BDV98DRAFT_558330 [Pterula gracilis]
MFLCIPIFFGFPKKIKPEKGEEAAVRVCPNCHNPSVIAVKSTTWFEFFFLPLFPVNKSKHLYLCQTCRWTALRGDKHGGTELSQPQGSVVADPGDRHIRPGYQPSYQQAAPPPHPPTNK